jgi:Lrp/AsnC family leucine-responsive transcriptional regulator
MKNIVELDAADAEILTVLQRTNRLSLEELAATVHLSTASCHRRVKRLRKEGVIVADVSVVDPAAIGRVLTILVHVTMERDGQTPVGPFIDSMRSDPDVMQCYYVTGDADFVLVVTARDMADYEAFTLRHIVDNPNVRRFQTTVVMDRVKTGQAVPVTATIKEKG